FGTDVVWWFAVVLVTHLLNVTLLYAALHRLTGSWRLASFGAALWGTAPMQEGALGWYAVYGHVLAGTCVLLVLVRLAARWRDERPLPGSEVAGWCVALVVASASFRVG